MSRFYRRYDHDRMVGLGCMGLIVAFVLLCMVAMVAIAWGMAP